VQRMVVLVVIALASSVAGFCKCANRFVYVSGHISGQDIGGVVVGVRTIPDANWELQPEITINEGSFKGKLNFDTTKSEGRIRDNCSRNPKIVEILLFRHGQQVDSISRDISKDFTKDASGDYKLRVPIEFRLQ